MTSASGFRRLGPGRLLAPILVALMAVLALLAAPTVTSPIVDASPHAVGNVDSWSNIGPTADVQPQDRIGTTAEGRNS